MTDEIIENGEEPVEITLLDKVKSYLRIDGEQDDALLTSLIAATKLYLANAGMTLEEGATEERTALYELAVSLHVHDTYYGGDAMQKALTAIILQWRYSGGEADDTTS
jgi:uncharacterized phage protein (predicted DNA packaging)